MPKNVTTLDDKLGTLLFPLNQAGIIFNFFWNYLTTLKINPENGEVVISQDGKKARVKIVQTEKMGKNTGYAAFAFRGKNIKLYFGSRKELVDTILMIKNEFFNAESGWLDVKGKEVVDIGAYVGDTAIFFLLNGAKHVYGIEPYPYFYEVGRKNVAINGMGSKITMVNAGVASKGGKVMIDTQSREFSGKSFKRKGNEKAIEMISLEGIVRKYGLRDAALKIDCEGHEYDIMIKAKNAVLRRFSEIEIEYHYGYLNLEKKLIGAGFSVEHHKPVKKFNFGTKSVMVNGFIHAKRI
ncbi:MAG: FkbM family methyltransferase [Candidatus Micrarchaeota archaeon]|nr:FkbM family methyltransferase [Candidatus Micrarchaeota archaeon]